MDQIKKIAFQFMQTPLCFSSGEKRRSYAPTFKRKQKTKTTLEKWLFFPRKKGVGKSKFSICCWLVGWLDGLLGVVRLLFPPAPPALPPTEIGLFLAGADITLILPPVLPAWPGFAQSQHKFGLSSLSRGERFCQ